MAVRVGLTGLVLFGALLAAAPALADDKAEAADDSAEKSTDTEGGAEAEKEKPDAEPSK